MELFTKKSWEDYKKYVDEYNTEISEQTNEEYALRLKENRKLCESDAEARYLTGVAPMPCFLYVSFEGYMDFCFKDDDEVK